MVKKLIALALCVVSVFSVAACAAEEETSSSSKPEKTHSLEHAHVLSGIVKCPLCGASMYGSVNRKKKKGAEGYYTDMWYYICKNRKNPSGKPCSFKTHIRQDIINTEVEAVIKWVLSDSDFNEIILKRVGSNNHLSELLQEQERLQTEKQKLETRKKKLLSKMGALNPEDDLYDELYDEIQGVLRMQLEQIKVIDENLVTNSLSLDNARNDTFSASKYNEILSMLIEEMDKMPDEDEKLIMQSILEKIEIYPERQADGRWVRRIQFKIPLNINNQLYDTIDIEDKISLPLDEQDETCVLLSHKNPQTSPPSL
ncbi:zinc ribbon domain-containing protein [Scatolibacter rhodanostii]|uniref:zinc ribbon domain-containing protein n=1 Tax=Scatolibacter rhodanostii TaxID=2014781 RepID=UPI000C072E5A|nr:zinc ribbon domain-containing protein [Scatolibacter rhodanostii]